MFLIMQRMKLTRFICHVIAVHVTFKCFENGLQMI